MTALATRPPGTPVTHPEDVPSHGWVWAFTDAAWRMCLVRRRVTTGAYLTYTEELDVGATAWVALARHRYVTLANLRNHGRRPARKDTAA